MREEIFSADHGDRPAAPNIGIIITDGRSNLNPERTVPEADRSREAGIDLYVIGVGFAGISPELAGLASPPAEDNVLVTANFEDLSETQATVFSRICDSELL